MNDITQLRVLSVRPGDVLVLEYPGVLSRVAFEHISDAMRAELPAGVRPVIFEKGMHAAGIVRREHDPHRRRWTARNMYCSR